jgi:hypothetical protein
MAGGCPEGWGSRRHLRCRAMASTCFHLGGCGHCEPECCGATCCDECCTCLYDPAAGDWPPITSSTPERWVYDRGELHEREQLAEGRST